MTRNFKLAKSIAAQYGYTGLKQFKQLAHEVEAESIHTGKRIKVDVASEAVYEFNNLLKTFVEVD